MDVWLHLHSYNTFGGHRTISLVGSWLQEHPAAPAAGLAELVLEANLRHSGPPRKTLQRAFEEFHAALTQLPGVVYSAKKRRLQIRYLSEVGDAGTIGSNRELSIELFLRAFDELAAVLESLPLEKKKGLDVRALRVWLRESRKDAPRTLEELQRFEEWFDAETTRRREAMSPWERLAIDWDEFHPKARAILDDPFFWSGIDDNSPHGNDTGADLLDMLRGNEGAESRPMTFLKQLFRTWGMDAALESAMAKPLAALVDAEETALVTWNEAAIALAYGLAKLRGRIPAEATEMALGALRRERELVDARGHTMDEERMTALAKLENKLLEMRGG